MGLLSNLKSDNLTTIVETSKNVIETNNTTIEPMTTSNLSSVATVSNQTQSLASGSAISSSGLQQTMSIATGGNLVSNSISNTNLSSGVKTSTTISNQTTSTVPVTNTTQNQTPETNKISSSNSNVGSSFSTLSNLGPSFTSTVNLPSETLIETTSDNSSTINEEIVSENSVVPSKSFSLLDNSKQLLNNLTDSNISIKDKISSTKTFLSDAKTEIGSVKNTLETVKESILNNKKISPSQITELLNTSSSLNSTLSPVLSSLKDLGEGPLSNISGLADKLNLSLANLDNVGEKISDIKNKVTGGIDKIKGISSLFSKKDKNEKEESSIPEMSFEEYMVYDKNGLKHFMNIFLDTLKSEGIQFEELGARRWAVDENDQKIFGNAFLCQQGDKTYKSLDSDGKYYWMSDYNSRHYYGEAVDITGSLSEILETISLKDKVLDVMHKFGICLQYETSQTGASKGTHFHCSTDENNPQTKWWGIVNQIRDTNNLKLYSVVASSDYYEKEHSNEVQIA